MAMGADYSFELTSIENYAPQFIGLNKLFLGSVKQRQFFAQYLNAINKIEGIDRQICINQSHAVSLTPCLGKIYYVQ